MKEYKQKINIKIAIQELHKAFAYLNRDLYRSELPEPAITIQSRGNNQNTLAWFTVGKVWVNDLSHEERCEINIAAEGLNRGLYPVMTSLLHEMTHYYNYLHGIQDVSRGKTYHNKKFKKTAEEHGLIIEREHKDLGWSQCSLSKATLNLINSYDIIPEAFAFGRREFIESSDEEGEEDKPKKKKSSTRKYVCPCCNTSIRATKEVNILCGDCNVKMILQEELDAIKELEKDTQNQETYVCNECGCISSEYEIKRNMCPSCGSKKIELYTKEEDAVLIDEDGKAVNVKQPKFM